MNARRNLWAVKRRARGFVNALAGLPLAGCSRAPSVEVLGSFFPAWLVCFVVAIVLTAIISLLLVRLRIELALPILVYAGLTALFTFALWLIFFY